MSVIRRIPAPEKWGVGGSNFLRASFADSRNDPSAVFTRYMNLTDNEQWENEIRRVRSFVQFLDIKVGTEECIPEFWLGPEDEAFAESVMPGGPVLGLFPGAASRFRQWPVHKWREFIRGQAVSRHLVVFGSQTDCMTAREMLFGTPRGLTWVDLTGRTTLRQLAACIRRCSWMVCMESAGLHMAVALGIPSVGLLGGHHYGRYYPWGDPRIHRVACHQMECFRCNSDCIYGDYRCVSDIAVDTVLRELLAIKDCGRLPVGGASAGTVKAGVAGK
jgi:ADP-heptose:LPS heptosyltransferase